MIQSARDVCLHTMNDYNIELFWFRALLFVFALVQCFAYCTMANGGMILKSVNRIEFVRFH